MPQINLGRVGFVNKGEWTDGSHKINDVVKYNNIIYVCTTPHTSTAGNILPTNGSYWEKWLDGSDWYTKTDIDNKQTGFKNYIINGNFDVWQRGTSQTSNAYGSDDRFINGNVGSTKTHSRQTCTDTERALFNAQYYSRTVVSSVVGTSNQVVKFQFIEDVTKLAGKTVTLSFWAKADSTKNIAIDFGQIFGLGGTPSTEVSAVGVTTFNLTSTWQKFTKTVTLPSIVGKTLGTDGVHTTSSWVVFWFDAGSYFNTRTNSLGQQSGTFGSAQIQLVEGSVATPFENLSYALQYEQCRRYYRRYATQQNLTDLSYQMRITPTESGTAPYTYDAEL